MRNGIFQECWRIQIFFLSVEEKQWLKNIFEPSKHPLNINIISNKLNKMFGTQPKKEIKSYKKMFSIIVFKKGSPSTPKSVSHKILFLRSIFSSQLLEQFLNKYYIVNIDEASFNRDCKQNYSWLPRGSTNPIINLQISGNWSWIAGIWSDGHF